MNVRVTAGSLAPKVLSVLLQVTADEAKRAPSRSTAQPLRESRLLA